MSSYRSAGGRGATPPRMYPRPHAPDTRLPMEDKEHSAPRFKLNMHALINSLLIAALAVCTLVIFVSLPHAQEHHVQSAKSDVNTFYFTLSQPEREWKEYTVDTLVHLGDLKSYHVCCHTPDRSVFMCAHGTGWSSTLGLEALLTHEAGARVVLRVYTLTTMEGSTCRLEYR